MDKQISIITPCRNEGKFIEAFLASICGNGYASDNFEIIIVDGESEDNTVDVIHNFMANNPEYDIKIVNNPMKVTPVAMNIGIKNAKYEYVMICGSHSSYPRDYFSKLLSWFDKLDADCIGGLWKTEVLNKNKKTESIKHVLTNKFGVGNGLFRLGVKSPVKADTVGFGCYRKTVFEKVGLINENLIRNQDIEFNKRISASGGNVYLVPDVSCTYFAREKFSQLALNNFKGGYWNPLTIYYTKNLSSLSLRHYIPFFFIMSILLPVMLTPLNSKLVLIAGISILAHFTLIATVSISMLDSKTELSSMLKTFYVLHMSHGFGSVVGLLEVARLKIISIFRIHNS